MNKQEYARRWASQAPSFQRVVEPKVPDDVERLFEHEPCFMCGTARGPCRHRRMAA